MVHRKKDRQLVGQLGVYFSYETRNHTLSGALVDGYSKDFSQTIAQLFRDGISPHTIFTIPEDTTDYPVILPEKCSYAIVQFE